MASIIPGYEYDVFISYRQKDNKYDGWVTEFIDHLKREIEATFKEDVSIYFDENPHNGLLEIHDVDKSLETKLKSLIFMPVVSQTYCDPNSFAWQSEFVAFNRMASADRLGKDVRLASGNVCSRIIPIKIHELDASDTELIENEMGCRLRAIEFIYSSAGVNRPLKPDDNPDKNLNKTFYRDQINKVANTVKDLIYGIHPDERKRAVKSYQTRAQAGYNENIKPKTIAEAFAPPKRIPGRYILSAILGLLIIIAMITLVPKLFKQTRQGFEKGVGYYKQAIEIDPADPEPYIGLAVGYGSAGHGAGIGSLEMAKAYAIKAIELDTEELHPNLADAHVVLAETYLYHDYDFVNAEHHLKRAIDLNPSSAPARYTYGWYLALANKVDEAADEMKKAIEIDPLDPICPGYLAWLYQWFGRYEDALTYAKDALKINPKYPMAYYVLGMVYAEMGRYEEAIDTLKRIYSPRSGFASGLGVAYAFAGQRDKAQEIAAEMEKQNMRWHTWGLADIYSALGDKDKAIYWVEEAYKQRHDFIPWIMNNPYYKKLNDDPRFRDIVKQLNLPE